MSRRTVEKFAKRVAQLDEQGADAVGIGQYVRRWLRWTSAGLDGRVRWKETGYPVGCESVIGRFLPDLLSLRDTGGLWSRPSINHITPTLISLSAGRIGAAMCLKKNRPGTHPGRLESSVCRSETCLPVGRPIAYARRRLRINAIPPIARSDIVAGSGMAWNAKADGSTEPPLLGVIRT